MEEVIFQQGLTLEEAKDVYVLLRWKTAKKAPCRELDCVYTALKERSWWHFYYWAYTARITPEEREGVVKRFQWIL